MDGITVGAVRRYARSRGMDEERCGAHERAALIVAVSRLLLALHRERIVRVTSIERRGSEHVLIFGVSPQLCLKLACPPVLGDFLALELPVLVVSNVSEAIGTPAAFLTALQASCPECEAVRSEAFLSDFGNSLANLFLNRVLHDPGGSPIEATWAGHTSFPFPGLRAGPGIREVARCSNVTGRAATVPLGVAARYRFRAAKGLGEADLFRAWSAGRRWTPGTVPIHPWQATVSPELRAALAIGLCRMTGESVDALPLASQRTFRTVGSGHDLKLAVNAALTGEQRLLFPVNVANAPAVSELAESLRHRLAVRAVGFQVDLASIAYDDEVLGRHVAAIVRAPLPQRNGEAIVPALSLWANDAVAGALFEIDGVDRARHVFAAYCRTVLHAPLMFYASAGMAFEPHLQNSLLRVRDGMPIGLVLRDLDATILSPELIGRCLREADPGLAPETSRSMPGYSDGGRRLMHALLFANIAPAALWFVRAGYLAADEVEHCFERAWDEQLNLHVGGARDLLVHARGQLATPKLSLTIRLRRSTELMFAALPAIA